jgi:hypothetical protein
MCEILFAYEVIFVSQRFQLMSDTAGNMLQSLGHCLSVFEQQEEVCDI